MRADVLKFLPYLSAISISMLELFFTILTATENESTGLEDVTWVKCLKSLGTLPNLPLFQILHDYDLSEDDDTVILCFILYDLSFPYLPFSWCCC